MSGDNRLVLLFTTAKSLFVDEFGSALRLAWKNTESVGLRLLALFCGLSVLSCFYLAFINPNVVF